MIILAPSAARPSPASPRVAPTTPYRTPDDTPCLPGKYSMFPRWVELEAERLEHMEAEGWIDEEPPSPAQERYLHVLGAEYIPISKDEATALISRLLKTRNAKRTAA